MATPELTEYDNVGGNYYDKYNTTNPIARALMSGFLNGFDALTGQVDVDRAFEVGCGEGHLSLRLEQRGVAVSGIDLEEDAIELAVANAAAAKSPASFTVGNLYDLDPQTDRAPLVICCEVLEHVPDPERALAKLVELADPWLLVSVPREPIWRAMNMARGKYIGDWGNTPGHIQHWSSGGFRRFVSEQARIIDFRTPLPWSMALCRTD